MKRKCFGALFALAGLACAATTSTWETSSTSDFLKGRLEGVSVLPEGWLRPGPALVHNTNLNEPVLWSLAPAPENGLYAATGHTGRIYRVDSRGAAKLLWKSPQPEVFALCVDAKGQLFAGTSPNGGVYRIENGKGVEVAHFGTKYIWALAATADGSVFAATGEQGRIYKIDASGHTSVYFETGQANVTALALGRNGHLYAGSEPNGLLYDIAGLKRGTVLYDSSLPEIHSIALAADGTIYAAALGGSLTSRITASPTTTGATGSMAVATSPTVISVSEAKEDGAPAPEQSGAIQVQSANKTNVTSTVTPTAVASPTTVDVSGVEKSAIYRIQPDGRVDTLRTSKEENVYDLALVGGTVWFSTDVHGRVYSITPDRKETLVTETGDGDADRLLNTTEGLWVGLSNPAKAVLVGKAPAATSAYESPVHDASTLARWGQLSWEERGSGISFQIRSGNSARADGTWSPWSAPIRDAGKALIESPRGRYVQWRAEWPAGSAAQLQDVTVPFLPQNSAPTVRSINVTSVSAASQNKSQAASSQSQSAYTVTVTDTGDTSSNSSGTTTQTTTRQASNQTQISWQADDPDGDKLVYAVYFRGEGQGDWKLLKKDLYENTLMLDADTLADGKYFFRVVASDRPANDLRYAQQDELISTPVLIDNTPPSVTMGTPKRSGTTIDVDVSAQDQAGPLKRCEYSVDAGPWQPLEAADGITDSPREEFHLQLQELGLGEHLVAVRVYDSAGNAGLAKVVIR